MKKIFFIVVLLIVAGLVLVFSPGVSVFEETPPKIEIENEKAGTTYHNPKKPLKVAISDESGVGKVEVIFSSAEGSQKLISQSFGGEKEVNLNLEFPKNIKYKSGQEYKLDIVANDTSKANFFSGNEAKKNLKVVIDAKAPALAVLNQSYKIIQGGAASAVFMASDDSGELSELYVESSFGKKFKPVPFHKDGYYAVLLAWPSVESSFSASVVATDKAGNTSKTPIRLYLQSKKYKESKIAISNAFIDGKITELANEYAKDVDQMDAIAKFKFVNETLRNANEDIIEQITSQIREDKLGEFKITPFYPLKNGAVVASFGDHRIFSFDGAELSESYHMGLDFASTAMAGIVASNGGEVVFADKNGIYGNNMIIYHGFGLYTLYGHCTTMAHEQSEIVPNGANIATTGTTGLALGDHLHFGVVIQGIEVRPEEWMDRKWMKESVYDILENSKKIIDGGK